MAWGTCWDGDGERIHVLPCTADGHILWPHIAEDSCLCHPREEDDGLVLIHEQVH